MVTKQSFLGLSFVVLLLGCTTVKTYVSKNEPGAAKPAQYPIYVYNEKVPVPRPYEIIGTMTISDTPLTVFGGSFEGELDTLRQQARKRGADGLQIMSVEPPDFMHAKYRITANFVRFTNTWEMALFSEADLRSYLTAQKEHLDPIEGFWQINDAAGSRVGIVRDSSRSGREFLGFLVVSGNPTWRPGDKKIELARGERAGVYRCAYYFDDYRRKTIAFPLLGAQTNLFILQMPADETPVLFTKE
ncbi:MAG: hypothetical protein QM813_20365 [Verrucomicrobiota bacterium]